VRCEWKATVPEMMDVALKLHREKADQNKPTT